MFDLASIEVILILSYLIEFNLTSEEHTAVRGKNESSRYRAYKPVNLSRRYSRVLFMLTNHSSRSCKRPHKNVMRRCGGVHKKGSRAELHNVRYIV